MTTERIGLVKLGDMAVTVLGDDVLTGHTAPEFKVQDNSWRWVNGIESTRGSVRIIGALPSLSTPVCDRETRHFNEEAAKISDDIQLMFVSMDLPPTQKNWCAAADVEGVKTLSDAFDGNFGVSYGVMIKEWRWFRRAVWVVDRKEKVVYSEYTSGLGVEPDYEAVLAAAREALT